MVCDSGVFDAPRSLSKESHGSGFGQRHGLRRALFTDPVVTDLVPHRHGDPLARPALSPTITLGTGRYKHGCPD